MICQVVYSTLSDHVNVTESSHSPKKTQLTLFVSEVGRMGKLMFHPGTV